MKISLKKIENEEFVFNDSNHGHKTLRLQRDCSTRRFKIQNASLTNKIETVNASVSRFFRDRQ